MFHSIIKSFTKTPLRRLVSASFAFVLAWRVLLEATNQIIAHTTHVVPFWPSYLEWVNAPANAPSFSLGNWVHWDGYHFLSIVLRGYHLAGPGGVPVETAFFPAFPVLVRVPSRILHIDPVRVGLFINFLLSVAIAIGVYKLAVEMYQRYLPQKQQKALGQNRVATLSVLLLFLYPASFFLASFYADALVVAGATFAIYFAVRGQYAFAAISSFGAMSAKTTGLVLVPTLLMILLENEKIPLRLNAWRRVVSWDILRKSAVLMSGIIIGLVGYMAYLWHSFGDPLSFSTVESVWGRQNSIWFLKRIFTSYYAQIIHPAHFGTFYQYLSIMIVMALPFVTIGLSIWYARRYKTYWMPVMVTLTMILPLMSGLMESLNRYTLILTPLAVALATGLLLQKQRKWLTWATLLIFAGLLFYFAGGFLNGNYFAG